MYAYLLSSGPESDQEFKVQIEEEKDSDEHQTPKKTQGCDLECGGITLK